MDWGLDLTKQNRNHFSSSTDIIREIFRGLGGEYRGWHPRYFSNDLGVSPFNRLDERPRDIQEEWKRPDLEHYSQKIGDMIEKYLEDEYHMEIVDNGSVDLKITKGPFEGTLVQAKGAIELAKQGRGDDRNYYSRPGGIYMNKENIEDLNSREENAILHTAVHRPMFEIEDDISAPVKDIGDVAQTALIGEMVLPVGKVREEVDFNSSGTCYWDWSEAYGDKPSTIQTVEKWYKDTFLDIL